MSDISFAVNRTPDFLAGLPAWEDVGRTFASGSVPHCWAVSAPLPWQETVSSVMSRMALCDTGRACGGCEGCLGWSPREGGGFRHPDLTVVGELGKAGNVEACRAMIKELMLKPVVAKRRLGVVLAADRLLVHAANSLLKVAEEPPSHACLLFLLEGSELLPTLRSRSRFTTLAAPLSFAASPMPGTEAEWLEWLENVGKTKDEADIAGFLSSWTSSLLEKGELELSARVEKLRLLALQKKLSQAMMCDLLTLTLKEELPFEHIFGGFR